jgi:hypothetical protein
MRRPTMATRVEELRKVIVSDWWFEQKVMDEVDALISAARAEGAATERERIRNAGEFVGIDDSMSGVEGKWASCSESRGEIDDMTAIVDPFIIPRSVLAPEKESGK